ncbi:MAG: phosphoribosyltransferase family protein [Anaerolineae bacterium]|nr:phosphoribosyltransferase family protein [Thermoflexales bacterium]MDW8395139.1 phosphoribosyltransferase family protein [Anaerolineae bacterium]
MVTALRESSLAVATGAVLVPVPLYVQRQRVRGYNHSALLARHIGQALELPVDERTLRRVRNTEQQARIRDDATRQANVRGAFKADPRCANAAQIILVDDVFTTGATLRECALALKAAGAQAVAALTLARARD